MYCKALFCIANQLFILFSVTAAGYTAAENSDYDPFQDLNESDEDVQNDEDEYDEVEDGDGDQGGEEPVIETQPQIINADLGGSAVLPCHVTGACMYLQYTTTCI